MPNVNAGLKRRTMVKPIVGKCRTQTYNLPSDPNFTYGMVNQVTGESAGAVVSSWDVSKKSVAQTTSTSFPATNIAALSEGCLSSKDQRAFAVANPVMKTKPEVGSPKKKFIPKVGPLGFGIQSEQNEIPMSLVMSAPDDGPERDYPVFSQHAKGKMPPPRPTKSSQLYAQKNEVVENPVDSFKMKKFKNVKSKVFN
ncbi:hypothetical protein TrRE_jg12004 [Triparma retinervis]|uniref:Uncharacterized protein n=1 Tax=Triparma retinervis TaxID=2557542 RepID=A0A9W6ZZU2_9STRA|nr:hypothetical protein TrRE_jg12004 [Triparma retinervis]